jgi:hypothetical protein
MPKDYQGQWKKRLSEVARRNMARISLAPKIDRENPDSNFDLVVSLIYMETNDQTLLDVFRRARLNVEDPFHWWQLLEDLIDTHTDQPAGASRVWTQTKIAKLERDSVRVSRREPATGSVVEISRRLKTDLGYQQTPDNLRTLITRLKLTNRIKKKIARKKK